MTQTRDAVTSQDDWPFDQPPNCATISLQRIVFGDAPILFVSHDADDHGWQFHGGWQADPAEAVVVCLADIVERDPTVREIADLPPGWIARRGAVGEPWVREVNSHADEDEGEEGPAPEPPRGSFLSRLWRRVTGQPPSLPGIEPCAEPSGVPRPSTGGANASALDRLPLIVRVRIPEARGPDAIDTEVYCVNDTGGRVSVRVKSNSFTTVDDWTGVVAEHGSGPAAVTLAPGEAARVATVRGWEWDGHVGLTIAYRDEATGAGGWTTYALKRTTAAYTIPGLGREGRIVPPEGPLR